MPRGDGTGPTGGGPRTGRGMGGMGQGRGGGGGGAGAGSGQGGRGRMGGPLAAGPAGTCVCPSCGHIQPHQRGAPCTGVACPKCGAMMTRG